MDDIDRTYQKLRRIDIIKLVEIHSPNIDSMTFLPVYLEKWHTEKLMAYGWTVEDANKELEAHFS